MCEYPLRNVVHLARYATDPNNICEEIFESLYRQAVKLLQVTTFWQLDKMTT